MEVKVYEQETTYKFVCTKDEYEFVYEYIKEPPEGVELSQYLQDCKENSIGLAEWELSKLEPPKELEV